MQRRFIFILTLLILISFSCSNERKWEIDTSKVDYSLKIIRWDLMMKKIDSAKAEEDYEEISKNFPDFDYLLTHFVWPNILEAPKELKGKMLYKYYHEPYMDSLYKDVSQHFPEKKINDIQDKLQEAIRRFKVIFPQKSVPFFATSITAFAAQSYQTDKTVGIGLDCYLGKGYKYYNSAQLDLPVFIIKRWEEKYLLSETMKSFYSFEFQENKKKSIPLLGEMIEQGKMLYTSKVLMPDLEDSTLLAYSTKEMKYADDYQGDIWKYLTTKGLLFKSDFGTVNPFFTPGPFTKIDGVNQETPSRIGEWIGLQIIKKYMNENRGISLSEMIKDKDYKRILRESKYKPK